jgi:hypothetical protein
MAGVALLALGGCSSKKPSAAPPPTVASATPATSTATPSGSASPAGTRSPTGDINFTVDGAGPYQLGTNLAALRAAGSLDQLTPGGAGCPQNTTAQGTGTWREIELRFRNDGVLYLAINRSASIPTPSGAWLGTTLTGLKKIYAAIPGQELSRGAAAAYLVTTLSGRGILFELDAVTVMTAADAAYLKTNFVGGTSFC